MWERRIGFALAVGCLVLAACGSKQPAAVSSSTTKSTTQATTTTTAPLTVAQTLERISIQPSYLGTGEHIALYQQGDDVSGQVTLDVCGAKFRSEARRRARHQVGVSDAHGADTGLSTEAVLYDSAAGAQQALREINAARAGCPARFVTSDVAGVPPIETTFGSAPDATWARTPGVTRVALAESERDQQGHSDHSVAVYQVRGALLVAFYSDATIAPGVIRPSVGGIEGVSQAIAQQMASLPAAALAPRSNA